jgi:hypothetical protein
MMKIVHKCTWCENFHHKGTKQDKHIKHIQIAYKIVHPEVTLGGVPHEYNMVQNQPHINNKLWQQPWVRLHLIHQFSKRSHVGGHVVVQSGTSSTQKQENAVTHSLGKGTNDEGNPLILICFRYSKPVILLWILWWCSSKLADHP